MASERTELQYAVLCMSFDLRWLKLSQYVIILQLSLKILKKNCKNDPSEVIKRSNRRSMTSDFQISKIYV